VLLVRERVSGPDHPDTLRARGHLARWTGEAGDPAPPGTCTPRCCPRMSGSSARSTPDTLAARANLAHWNGRADDAGPNAK
jgi:hypothetical protein